MPSVFCALKHLRMTDKSSLLAQCILCHLCCGSRLRYSLQSVKGSTHALCLPPDVRVDHFTIRRSRSGPRASLRHNRPHDGPTMFLAQERDITLVDLNVRTVDLLIGKIRLCKEAALGISMRTDSDGLNGLLNWVRAGC